MGVCECVCSHAMGGKVSVKLSPLPYFKGTLFYFPLHSTHKPSQSPQLFIVDQTLNF